MGGSVGGGRGGSVGGGWSRSGECRWRGLGAEAEAEAGACGTLGGVRMQGVERLVAEVGTCVARRGSLGAGGRGLHVWRHEGGQSALSMASLNPIWVSATFNIRSARVSSANKAGLQSLVKRIFMPFSTRIASKASPRMPFSHAKAVIAQNPKSSPQHAQHLLLLHHALLPPGKPPENHHHGPVITRGCDACVGPCVDQL
eukprot:366175-Chlamydomonas_euryale.AAC.13